MSRNTKRLLKWVTVVLLTTVTYGSAVDTTTYNDPCNNYTALDQPWRATNATGLEIYDSDFNWTGWYRLLYYGMSVRMPESCVGLSYCGTLFSLSLNSPHPRIEDGVVTHEVCMCFEINTYVYMVASIRVKACPGDYYVYEFVRPTEGPAAYCADMKTIGPTITLATETSIITMDSPENLTFDPCTVYSVLENEWRITDVYNYTSYQGYDDTLAEWKGWYRLYLQGRSAQIPDSDWCASYMTCGGYTPLFLGGSHPRPQDGIVTRDIYGSYGFVIDSSQCNSYRSNPIQIKACPGDYYVYRLVRPTVSLPMPTYCAVIFNTPSYDPCNNYTALDQPWRATNATGLNICDNNFIWTGWYRLLHYGMSVRMPDSCVNVSRCGTNITLWMNGSHPQIEDGIVTRRICGSSRKGGCYYRSFPIRVKACPGDYYVYEFVRPTTCDAAYCADVNTIAPNTSPASASSDAVSNINTTNITSDPCSVYSVLDDDWRKPHYLSYPKRTQLKRDDFSHNTYKIFDDTLVEWYGWYRLYLKGKSAQIPEPEWAGSYMSCGGYTALFLGGSHPRPQDDIVTREMYGIYYCVNIEQCFSYRSDPIQVKGCPGDYYVYRLVKPAISLPMPTYCAVDFKALSYDPCNDYTALDQPWRGTNETTLWICDRQFNWTGWYRLLYNGMSVQVPESCINVSSCGTEITLWLNGSHPQIEDGIVTCRICGSSEEGCCDRRVTPIRVKACPGDYYVYEFVKPDFCDAAYCADVNTITSNTATTPLTSSPSSSLNTTDSLENMTFDPCSVYTVLNDDWRRAESFDYYLNYLGHDDTVVEWKGWYRLYLQGESAQIPESDWCVNGMSCGGYTPILLGGSHPLPEDGIVTRDIYGCYHYISDITKSSALRSNPIQVKACPGNYFDYRLVKPAVSIPMPTYCAVVLSTPSYDPCYNYTSLDQPWRGSNEIGGFRCDEFNERNVWYRLLYRGRSVRMSESCVKKSRCGTYFTLWLTGSHPQIEDGIVTLGVCLNIGFEECCFFRSTPIRVKACPGDYYVYEFARTNLCASAYCADQSIKVPPECTINFTAACSENLFSQIQNSTNPVLPSDIVEKALQEQVLNAEVMNADQPVVSGNTVLNKTEILVSTLVMPTVTNDSVNISINGLDVQVFTVGPNVTLKTNPQLSVDNAQMDIDLIQISRNSQGSAAVAFLSYTNLSSMLDANFFNSTANTVKTMISSVVSATLPKTLNTQLTKPVNFTLKHIQEVDPNGTLTCVYWKDTEWVVDGCDLLRTNISHSVCSCTHLSTFALIMQTDPPEEDDHDPVMDHINTVAVAVGLVFLSLALLTFVICRRNPRVTNTAQMNLCISLFLAHLLFLLTQKFLSYIKPQQLVCAALAGVLHFFFLSAFVWMFIEAVLLFISVKNLTKIRSNEKAGLWGKWLVLIGYAVPLVIVSMSAGLVRDGYGSKKCWIKKDFLWSFLGPVSFILAANTILFITIMIILISTLTNMKSEILRIQQSESDQRLFKIVTLKAMIQLIILGCSWILGFFSDRSKMLDIVFIFLNSQQGTFIFLVHCVFNQEVRQLYMQWWRGVSAAQAPRNQETTTSKF